MSEVSRKRDKKTRKFDHAKKFGVRKKRWEVESEEIVSLQARLEDLDCVSSHAVALSDVRAVSDCYDNDWRILAGCLHKPKPK